MPAFDVTVGHNRLDDDIFEHTMRDFPELAENDHEKVTKLDEDWMKSKDGKERWRKFIQACVLPGRPCANA